MMCNGKIQWIIHGTIDANASLFLEYGWLRIEHTVALATENFCDAFWSEWLVYTVYLTSFFFSFTSVLQVPEIISTLRQAGKSSARQEDTTSPLPSNDQPDASCSTAMTVDTATAFAKKFEVLFCGRVVVAHKKAPPALIDECIEKFGRVSVTGSLAAGIRRAFSLNQVTLKFRISKLLNTILDCGYNTRLNFLHQGFLLM